MNISTAQTCKIFDLSDRLLTGIQITKQPKRKKGHRNAITKHTASRQKSASWFRPDDLNVILEDLFQSKKYFKANIIIFACNSGYRYGDIMTLRVKDLTDNNGKIVDYLTLQEDKTDKWRTAWLCDTVKKMLSFIIKYYGLDPEDYIFQSGERKRKYIEDIFLNEDGEEEIIYINEKYDWNGRLLRIAPMELNSVTTFLKNITAKHGIEGKYSTHSFRQTHSVYISCIQKGSEDVIRDLRIACQSLGHSDLRITEQHYSGCDSRLVKEQMLKMEVGKEVVDKYVK